MAGITAVAGNVGAGVSQVRTQVHVRAPQVKDHAGSSGDVSTVALQLIQRALSKSGTAHHDLDVLA